LIASDPRSEELLKPILRGRDIARYRAKWAGLWLISTFPSVNLEIEDYPAVKSHLLAFGKERLAQSGEQTARWGKARKKTPHQWFELQDTCAYHAKFSEEKLFWMDLTSKGKFSYVPADAEMLCANTVYFMHGQMMKCLAAFLNSSLVSWYVNRNTVTSGMGTARWFGVTVDAIPIPRALDSGRMIEALVDEIMTAIDEEAWDKVETIETAIEQLVYDAYEINSTQRDIMRLINVDHA